MIGEVLRKWRIMSDLSLKQVAEQVGISYSTLCGIEAGRRFDGEVQLKLIKWLFERSDNGKQS